MMMRKTQGEMKIINLKLKKKLIQIFLGMNLRKKVGNKLLQSGSPSSSKMKKEKEKIVMRFLYFNGILKRIGIVSIKEGEELEQYLKRKQEMLIIEQSNERQRFRIQQLIGFSKIFDSMFKKQISHVGHRRCIPAKEFVSFMIEANIILEELNKKICAPKSLRDITKQKLFLHQIPHASICLDTLQNKNFSFIKFDKLPKTLQLEMNEFCIESRNQEDSTLNLINSCLSCVSELYCKAFSCNSSSICQKFCFYVE